jgi:ferrous iron transport protein B
MKKILLMGNPNVGKSAVFSRMTGIHVTVSNYPGTTVEFTQGQMKVGEEDALLIDVPGTYDLETSVRAEEIAVEMLKDGDVVIDVVDATNLERNLHLSLHLLERDVPVLIALNMWDDAGHKGITINAERMEEILGVPVVPTVGVTGEGIRNLVSRIPEAANPDVAGRTDEERWAEVGRIVNDIQSLERRHHTFLEMLGDASVRPSSGIPIAVLVLLLTFYIVRFIGEGLTGYVFEPLFETLWLPVMARLSAFLVPGTFLHSIVIGALIDGRIDFVQSFGLLTTGIFVPLGMVLPYVFSFYLVIGFLEDLGYLPRVAVLLDNMMHKMGLHGWAIIPTILGLGCNVPGIMATRVLEDRRERMIAATIISVGVPCAALQAMIWGLLGEHGGVYVGIVYAALFLVWVMLGRVLNRMLEGRSPELIMEIPPYRLPSTGALGKKLYMRMVGFFREAIPVVLAGVLVVNILYFLEVFDVLAGLTAPVVTSVFGLPEETITAIAIGFLRKDVAIGMLGTLDLTAKQLTVACTVLAMFFPCVATFVVLFKELGWADTLRSVLAMLVTSLVAGGLLNLIL